MKIVRTLPPCDCAAFVVVVVVWRGWELEVARDKGRRSVQRFRKER